MENVEDVEDVEDVDDVIRSNAPGSFPYSVLRERHPALIQRVRDAFPYDPERQRALDAFLRESTDPAGVMEPLPADARDREQWEEWGSGEHVGGSWFDAPFLWAESYFYRRLLGAVGYFDAAGPWQGIDPFRPFKQAELRSPEAQAELTALDRLAQEPPKPRPGPCSTAHCGATVRTWASNSPRTPPTPPPPPPGGRLGTPVVAAAAGGREHSAHGGGQRGPRTGPRPPPHRPLPTPRTRGTSGPPRKATPVLRLRRDPHGRDRRPAPPEASSGRGRRGGRTPMASDINGPTAAPRPPVLLRPAVVRRNAGRPEEALRESHTDDPEGRPELPPSSRRPTPAPTTPFPTCTSYFPTPVAALRTLKSDVIVGLEKQTEDALNDSEPESWRTQGTHAVIQVRGEPR